MFDQTPCMVAGDRLCIPWEKCGKGESRMSGLQSWHRTILIVVLAGLAVAVLAWIACTDPAINYLPRYRGADWIVFPTMVAARAHWFSSLDVTYRREFVLANEAGTARLSPRAMRRAEVKITGTAVHFLPHSDWKNMRAELRL